MEALMKSIPTTHDITIETAVATYGQPLLRYCHLLLKDYHEAQDAVQTTFIKAFYGNTSQYPPDEISPILYKIAYNHAMDILRGRRRFFNFLQKERPATSYYIEETLSEEINSALSQLAPKDRGLIVNHLIEGMDYSQLSQIYNAPEATLRKRYQRAKARFANALRQEGVNYE